MEKKEEKILETIPISQLGNFNEKIAYIEIPKDIRAMKKKNLKEAYEWRMNTREQFEPAFRCGFIAEGIVFSEDQQRIFYKLKKKDC